MAIVTPVSIVYQTNSISTRDHHTSKIIAKPSTFTHKVDYQQVRKLLKENDFSDRTSVNNQIKKFNLKQLEVPKGNELTPEALDKVHEMQDKFLDQFEKNNLNLGQIDDYLRTKFPQYANVSRETTAKYADIKVDETQKNFALFYHTSNNFYISREDAAWKVCEAVDSLTSLENKLIAISAVAAVAAAGFWASAWWFGITIPWAVAATAIATTCGIGAHRIATERSQNGISSSVSLSQVLRELQSMVRILGKILSVVKIVKFVVWATVEASSWACIPAKAVNILISAIISKLLDWGIDEIISAIEKEGY